MSLYLGNDKVVAMHPNTRAWWGIGQNPKLLYEANFECSLANGTNYASKTPSSTQQSVNFNGVSPYSNTASTTITFDQYGVGTNQHNGEAFNFQTNEYYVLADYLINIKYINEINEKTWDVVPHALKYTYTAIMPAYRNYGINTTQDIATYNTANFAFTYYGIARVWYRNTSKALASVSTTYGFYITPAVPTLGSSNTFINFRTPTLYFRSSDSYHKLAAFIDTSNNNAPQIDTAKTIFKTRQRLYKAEKTENYYETIINRQAYIFNNADNNLEDPNSLPIFPVEKI